MLDRTDVLLLLYDHIEPKIKQMKHMNLIKNFEGHAANLKEVRLILPFTSQGLLKKFNSIAKRGKYEVDKTF